jgi:hypothetical protein
MVRSIYADVTDEFMREFVRELQPANCAVIADVLEDWTTPIDVQMRQLGGRVVREPRRGFVNHLMEKQADDAAERRRLHRH